MINFWKKFSHKIGAKRARIINFLLFIGFLGAIIQLLILKRLNDSALLYILIPYIVSIFIAWFRPYKERESLIFKYFNHLGYALIIFLSTSIILGEGFICVVFFFPIYLIIVSLAFSFSFISQKRQNKSKKILSVTIPLLFILMSLEGTSTFLSLSRNSFIEISRVTSLSTNEIKQNIAKPFDLEKDRHWLISIFPMPYRIDAGSLETGDVHKFYTRYHRWFVANTHEGMAELLIESVNDNEITTKILTDTTYFSSYIDMHGTRITFSQITPKETEVTLRINYQRKLDPAWYFHPLINFALSKMANLLIDEIMIRE